MSRAFVLGGGGCQVDLDIANAGGGIGVANRVVETAARNRATAGGAVAILEIRADGDGIAVAGVFGGMRRTFTLRKGELREI